MESMLNQVEFRACYATGDLADQPYSQTAGAQGPKADSRGGL